MFQNSLWFLCSDSEAIDESQPPVHAQMDESGKYTQISSAGPVNLSKSKELSEPSQNIGETEDMRKFPMLTILYLMRFTTEVLRP